MTAVRDFAVDEIVLASNEHWLYLDFWPFVAYAYRTLFPGVKITLAFLSERLESDLFVARLREHGDVVLVRPRRDVPQAAQAKLVRYFVAATRDPNAVLYTDDIDWIPVDRAWHVDKVRQRRAGTFLLVGGEVYNSDIDQTPVGCFTAEARLFRALFNPDGLPFDAWISTLIRDGKHMDLRSRADHEGDASMSTSQDALGISLFSDEALIARLRAERSVPVTRVERGCDFNKMTIDRGAWEALDRGKLESGGYVGAHTGRPWREYRIGNEWILNYIRRRYFGMPLPKLIEKTSGVDLDMRFEGGVSRDVFEKICQYVPANGSVLELGSGHVSTNYLSRYFWVVSVEENIAYVNQYPSYYIYAPLKDGWYDVGQIERGLAHRRIRQREGPARRFDAVLVDGPATRADLGDLFRILGQTPQVFGSWT